MRSPYSTPHIYGVERALSSLRVPFCRPSLTKRIAASREEIWVKHEIPLNFSTALKRSGLHQIHKYGNWITALKTSVHHFRFENFPVVADFISTLQALYYSDGNIGFSRRHAPCHATDQFRSQLTLTLTVAILGPSARQADRRVRCGPGDDQMTTGKVLMTSLPSQRGHCQNGRDAKNCQEVRIG